MSEKLSAVIITKNEEKNIERLLKSLEWVDEIVVCDTGSSDSTINIAQKYNCKIFSINWQGFGLAKRQAVEKAKNDWVLSVDADEEVSTELKNHIIEILKNPKYNCYYIKRVTFYLGKKINFCGWRNDFPKRLFNKKFGNFNTDPIHESLVIDGERGKIFAPLLHYTYPNISTHFTKMNLYSDIAADKLKIKNHSSSILASIFFGIVKFIQMYFFKLGFLDGRVGFILCFNSAIGVYLKYIKTWKTKN